MRRTSHKKPDNDARHFYMWSSPVSLRSTRSSTSWRAHYTKKEPAYGRQARIYSAESGRRYCGGRYAQLQFYIEGRFMNTSIIKYLLAGILCVTLLSCNKNGNPVSNGGIPPTNESLTKSLLQGTWRNTDVGQNIAYVVYDSATSVFSVKLNYGFNFRDEQTNSVKVDSNRVLWSVGGQAGDWYWMRWSQRHDTLVLSYDSLFSQPMTFVRDNNSADANPWIDNLPSAQISFYPSINSWVRALAYSDSTYYVLTGGSGNDGVLRKVHIGDTSVTSFSFPTATAMDISGNALWLAGGFYLEKRNLSDTTLMTRYDLTQYFTGNGGNNWIQGIAVDGDSVLVMGSFGKFLIFSSNGTLLKQDSTFPGLEDMMAVNGKLWGITTSSVVYEIDLTTMNAEHSYEIAGGGLQCRFQGIAYHDGKIACADFSQNILSVWETPMP